MSGRARRLIAQLRGFDPPLSESEITHQRLSLEEAVRKVESEVAQRAREASRAGSRSGDAFRAGAPRANPTKPGDPPPPPAPGRRARQAPPQQRNLRPEQPASSSDLNPQPPSPPRPPQPSVGMQDPTLPPARDRPVPPRRPDAGAQPPNQTQSPGVRGFRDIAADADDLGRAAAQANRSARKTYANVPSPSPEFDRLEPSMENRGADPDLPYSYDEVRRGSRALDAAAGPARPAPARAGQERKKKAARAPRIGGGGFPFKSAIAIGIVLILAGAAILWGPSAVSFVRNMLKPSATVEAPKDSTTPGAAAENRRPRRPAVVVGDGGAGGAARGAV